MTRHILEVKIDGTIADFVDEKNNHYNNSVFRKELLNEKEQYAKLENYESSSKATLTVTNIVAIWLVIDYEYQPYIHFKTSDGVEYSIHAKGINIHMVDSSYHSYDFKKGEYVYEMDTLVSYINGRKKESNYSQGDEKIKYNFHIQYKNQNKELRTSGKMFSKWFV